MVEYSTACLKQTMVTNFMKLASCINLFIMNAYWQVAEWLKASDSDVFLASSIRIINLKIKTFFIVHYHKHFFEIQ